MIPSSPSLSETHLYIAPNATELPYNSTIQVAQSIYLSMCQLIHSWQPLAFPFLMVHNTGYLQYKVVVSCEKYLN